MRIGVLIENIRSGALTGRKALNRIITVAAISRVLIINN